MKRIEKIINDNGDVPFVVMTQNKEQYETLRDILIRMEYEAAIPLMPLGEMMDDYAKEANYKCGWRISKVKGVAWNESLEHWKQYYSDILEVNEEGDLCFIE